MLPLALPALVALGGCGKSDKQKVVDKVNSICKDFKRDTGPLFKNVSNLQDLARQGKRALPAIDRAGRRLSTVKASESVRKDLGSRYTAFVRNFGEQAAAFGAAVAAAEAGDKKRVAQLGGEINRLDKQSAAQARKLGFDECAKG